MCLATANPGVTMPWIDLNGLLETAFEQLRHYAESDLPVSLRLLRTLGDIAVTTSDEEIHGRLLALANRVMDGARARLNEAAVARLGDRLAALYSIVGAASDRVGTGGGLAGQSG
jgi:uncharacterized membrane protein